MTRSLRQQAKEDGITPAMVHRLRNRGVLEMMIYGVAAMIMFLASRLVSHWLVVNVLAGVGGVLFFLCVCSIYAAYKAQKWLTHNAGSQRTADDS